MVINPENPPAFLMKLLYIQVLMTNEHNHNQVLGMKHDIKYEIMWLKLSLNFEFLQHVICAGESCCLSFQAKAK